MAPTGHLVFRVRGARYAIPALAVREIVHLPALTPMPDAPPHVAGIIDFRGRVVPAVDLATRLGHAPGPLGADLHVLLLESGDRVFGVIVDDVVDVSHLAPESAPGAGVVAKVEDGIVRVVDAASLAAALDEPGAGRKPERPPVPPEEARVLTERANALRRVATARDEDDRRGVAVFKLSGERFGADLRLVREFAAVGDVTPVPGAPSHVVGAINLRGDVLTLLDLRGALGLPNGRESPRVALIVQHGSIMFGAVVDEVLDATSVAKGEIAPAPAGAGPFVSGLARATEGPLTMLDLAGLVASGELEVNEA